MADNLLEALGLVTKVSAKQTDALDKISKRLDNIESNTAPAKNKETLKTKAEPVVVEDFGKKAEKDFSDIFGNQLNNAFSIEKEAKEKYNKNLTKGMLLAAAGLASAAYLFSGEGFTGLAAGMQNVASSVTNWSKKTKGNIKSIGRRFGSVTDEVLDGAENIVKGRPNFINSIKNMRGTIRGSFSRIASFFDDFAKNSKNLARTVATSTGDDIIKGTATAGSSTLSRVTPSGGNVAGEAADIVADARLPSGYRNTATGQAVSKAAGDTATGTVQGLAKGGKKGMIRQAKDFLKNFKPAAGILGKIVKNPLFAPFVETFFMRGDIAEMLEQHAIGEITEEELHKEVGGRFIKGITGVALGAAGAIGGGAIAAGAGGLASFGIGAVPAGIIGSILGGFGGDAIGRYVIGPLLAAAFGPVTRKMGKTLSDNPSLMLLKENLGTGNIQPQEIEDGIITKEGQVIKPDSMDTIYAMKEGGPLGDMLSETPKALMALMNIQTQEIELLRENNQLLSSIYEKIMPGGNVINNSSSVNVTGETDSLNKYREIYA